MPDRRSPGGKAGAEPGSDVSSDAGSEPQGWALPLLSVIFLGCYSALVLAPAASAPVRAVLLLVLVGCWVALIVYFVARLVSAGAGSRGRFVREHPQNLAAAIFPLLGAFVVLRRLNGMPGLRGHSGNALRSRVGVRAALYAVTFVYVMALTELAVERGHPGATIHTFGNAMWWACVTIATVGYGDFAPVTPLGRIVAVALMVGGVVIIGTTSALIVSYLSERLRTSTPPKG
jgi:voltage-gated potassium channel